VDSAVCADDVTLITATMTFDLLESESNRSTNACAGVPTADNNSIPTIPPDNCNYFTFYRRRTFWSLPLIPALTRAGHETQVACMIRVRYDLVHILRLPPGTR